MPSLIFPVSLKLARPTSLDKRADRERLIEGLAGAGVGLPVEISTAVLRDLPRILRENDFSVNPVIGYAGDRTRLVSAHASSLYAVALDIGSTNLAASLFDMKRKQKIASAEAENPQVAAGLDVLTRVHLSMSGRGADLHGMLLGGINGLIRRLCRENGIGPSDIHAAVFAGNTIMTHFLLGLPVDAIPVEPYIPAAGAIGFIRPGEIDLDINSEGILYVFPNAGSYVGGDIIAGILSSGLHRKGGPSILVDVGTNSEIALGCDEWIIVGAGAAGPALEGGIAEIGMRALPGAICRVGIERSSAGEGDRGIRVMIKTIGDREPRGICGSGMIELVAELYNSGIIDRQGRFAEGAGRIVDLGGNKGFVVYESAERRLIVRDTDIDNFLRSKAAMFSSLHVIVKSVGLSFGEIEGFSFSGALGSGIDANKAAMLGMIPDIDRRKVAALGNSSLRGAEMLLMDSALLGDIDRICGMVTYREMNTDGEFMKEFPAAMFIPHTNPEVLKG